MKIIKHIKVTSIMLYISGKINDVVQTEEEKKLPHQQIWGELEST